MKWRALVVGASWMAWAAACSTSSPARPAAASPTFAADIAPLVREKCVGCHSEGGSAPFALTTYEQVAALGALAKEKVTRREMPPWGAFDQPACEMLRPLKDDLSLTDAQIAAFARWVDGGMPRGDEPAPVVPTSSKPSERVARRTHALEVAGDFEVPGNAGDDLRCFPIDPGFTDGDRWVTESMIVPREPKVLHHALVYIDEGHEGVARAKGQSSYPCFGGPGMSEASLVLAWSPGGAPTVYGEGAALKIPKNAHLVVQAHYHPLGSRTSGALTLELAASRSPSPRVASFVLIGGTSVDEGLARLRPGPNDPPSGPVFSIPSGAKGHTETLELVIPDNVRDSRVVAAGAHMHWAGVGMTVEVERARPVGAEPSTECLLSQPRYDFKWQRTFGFDAPLANLPVMRAGDTLRIVCTYDNTMDNPNIARVTKERRETRPAEIRLGGDSRDEMCQAMLVLIE